MLLKSIMARTWYTRSSPSSITVMLSCVRARNTYPKFRAAVTSASSSGDAAWYTSWSGQGGNHGEEGAFPESLPSIRTRHSSLAGPASSSIAWGRKQT